VKTLITLMLFLEQSAGGSSQPEILGDKIFWLSASNSILFGTTPLNAQNDRKSYRFGE